MKEITKSQTSGILKNAKGIFILVFACLGLNINAQPSSCSASFVYEVHNQVVTFTRTSQANLAGMSYSWGFGDGTSGTSSTNWITHTYPQNGNYQATLTISNPSANCSAQFHDTVKVFDANAASCHAQFSNVSSQGGNTYFFNTSYGNVINSQWDFGDGTILYDSLGGIYNTGGGDVSHTFAQSGTYNVCLTVSNDSSSNSYCSTVTAFVPCNANFTAIDSALELNLYDLSSVSANSVYYWNFGDGSSSNVHGSTVHNYLQAGTYNVCLTVSDSVTSCTHSHCDTITLGNYTGGTGCYVPFYVHQDSLDPLYYDFHLDFDSTIINPSHFHWDFGDGTTLDTPGITYYMYSQSGTYNVCLTVSDSITNCSGSFCVTVTTGNNPVNCNASFSVMQDSTDMYNYTVYSYSSSGSNYMYFWDFGDGTSSTLQYPNHIYPGNGPYYLCSTVSDTMGNCSDTHCDSLFAGRSSGISLSVVAGVTGIAEHNSEILSIDLFPNPASDNIIINYGKTLKNSTLEIYDVTGQLIKKENIDQASTQSINISEFPKGLYILKISDGKNLGVKRFVKQ
jgi:PKD repeat protein